MARTSRPNIDSAVADTLSMNCRPGRRWSDGPNYDRTIVADEDWSLSTHWPAIAALMCERVAEEGRRIVAEAARLHAAGRLSLPEARQIAAHARSLAVSNKALQQIVRLGSGAVRPVPARIELTRLLHDCLRERQDQLLERNCAVKLEVRRADVFLDPSLGHTLVNAALDWALSFGDAVTFKVEEAGADRPVRLGVQGVLSGPAKPRRNRRTSDNLHWFVLSQLASVAGLDVSRSSTGATESTLIDFPRTLCAPAR